MRQATYIHSVHHQVFMSAHQNHLLRKSLPKIFFHFAKQEKQKKYGHTYCNVTTTTHNNQTIHMEQQ